MQLLLHENIVFEAWPKGFFGAFTENITEEAWETISNILMYELDWTKINEDMLELVEDAKEKYNKEREIYDEHESYTG